MMRAMSLSAHADPGPLPGRLAALRRILGALSGAVVAYSGGVDSALLAEVAHQVLGAASTAVTADSPSLPRKELEAATALAKRRGWGHLVVGTAELDDPGYVANPRNRCYHCKSALFDRLQPLADDRGALVLLGTVTDDLADWRPGHAAATERGGRHPLVEAGLSKADVRKLSAELGLPTAAKPAAACLSSRLAYGVPVTIEALARVERAEELVASLGFSVLRVRDLGGDAARVEVGTDELARLAPLSRTVTEGLRGLGFATVAIDERGYRRGALNEGALIPAAAVTARRR
jgi:pyridinium-3,5-biscarboxylic acid mononucleotide sulfurtransferase